jgi:hypothetical protein
VNLTLPTILLGIGAAAATAVAVWAGDNTGVAVPAAAAAVLGIALLASMSFAGRIRPTRSTFRPPERATLVLLRESFRSGPLGRQSIITTIGGLDASIRGSRRAVVSMDEESRIREMPPSEFRQWVETRLSELEQES